MKNQPVNLSRMSDNELLQLKLCDLKLKIEGSPIEKYIARLYGELDQKGIQFHPLCYLADEWLCPDGEPVIGIPFYLAHSRLRTLENKIMLEVEGGDVRWFMRLIRHETGHTLNYAYSLYRKTRWRELFGSFSTEYADSYKYRPYSKRFVRHLDDWYAQYHPDEDFAETFAVWLDPKCNWKRRYKNWPALDKLQYVDRLMKKIGDRPPRKAQGKKYWEISKLRRTLKAHYERKREFYADHYPDFHDFQLLRLFALEPAPVSLKADTFIQLHRKLLLDEIAGYTGEKKHIISDLLKDLCTRARELNLFANPEDSRTILRITAYVTTLTMNYLHTGTFKKERKPE